MERLEKAKKTEKIEKVCILGAGSWGTAQALVLHHNELKTTIWGKPDEVSLIKKDQENRRYLPNIPVPSGMEVTSDLTMAVKDAQMIVLAVPAQALREVLQLLQPLYEPGTILVNTAKGIEIASGMRLSQVAVDVFGEGILDHYAVLSGPSHAEEVARQIPSAVSVASLQQDKAFVVQDAYMSPYLRVYTNPDVAGVELGGALKNVIALAAGMVVGLGYGDNTLAALMTRGLTEIMRMGQALGGDYRTFTGLSGMGDLTVTCCSDYSRNRRAGVLIGKGYSLDDALQKIGMVVEGLHTTRVIYRLAQEMGIEMPISQACYNILYLQAPVLGEVSNIMCRRKKHEIEDLAR